MKYLEIGTRKIISGKVEIFKFAHLFECIWGYLLIRSEKKELKIVLKS